MTHITFSKHASTRLAQRGVSSSDAELIVTYGTEVEGGYIFLEKNCTDLEQELKAALKQVRHLRGKRVVVEDGYLVTTYHATRTTARRLLKFGEERQQEIWS